MIRTRYFLVITCRLSDNTVKTYKKINRIDFELYDRFKNIERGTFLNEVFDRVGNKKIMSGTLFCYNKTLDGTLNHLAAFDLSLNQKNQLSLSSCRWPENFNAANDGPVGELIPDRRPSW